MSQLKYHRIKKSLVNLSLAVAVVDVYICKVFAGFLFLFYSFTPHILYCCRLYRDNPRKYLYVCILSICDMSRIEKKRQPTNYSSLF